MCFWRGLYFVLKTFLLSHTALLRCFICSRAGILDPPWCNSSCRAYQELGQGNFYSFDPEKVWFLSIYLLPTHKKNVTTKISCLLQSRLQHLSQGGHLWTCKTSDFFFLLLFLVNSPPSTTTLRFSHSSSMNISLQSCS